MYCPRCGKQFSDKTSYCRTCGLSLDGVSEIVSGEAGNAPQTTTRPNNNVIRLGIGLFIFGTVLGLVNAIIREFGFYPEIYGKIVFLTFFASGLLCIGLAFVFPTIKYTKRKRTNLPSNPITPNQLDTAKLVGRLPSADLSDGNIFFLKDERRLLAVEPDSVTEHTTRQLE